MWGFLKSLNLCFAALSSEMGNRSPTFSRSGLISQVIRCAARRKPLEIRKRVFSRLFKREWA